MKKIFYCVIIIMILTAVAVSAADTRAIDEDMLRKFETDCQKALADETVINAVTNNSLNSLTVNHDLITHHDKFFNVKLKSSGVTNQKSSGRCWLFATLNVFNQKIARQLNHEKFELSQPYLTFWDKMEKANVFLEDIIDYIDYPLDSREMATILRHPFGDGGQWMYAVNLIAKYGAVPIAAMPETKQSVATGTINNLAGMKLKGFAAELRKMYAEGKKISDLRKRKADMLSEIYKLMVFNYGQPPKEFVFRYEQKDRDEQDSEDSSKTENKKPPVYISETHTPKTFLEKYIAKDLLEYISLIDYPTRPYDQTYRWQWGNLAEQPQISSLNLPVAKLKEYTMKMLLDSLAVCFACDVGWGNLTDSGIFAYDMYEYDKVLDVDFTVSKADRVDYREGAANHMMVIIGVDTTAQGQPVKWLVENSWGDKRGDKGFWYMYDNWFDEYVYEVIIDKKYLTDEDRKSFEKEPVSLPLWDYFYNELIKK
ncbi:MAG: aminopeptidase [candidate division Zixibacteria bacterium]|nr:aminopeptidase [candidate division Zixibacteria bacterium]